MKYLLVTIFLVLVITFTAYAATPKLEAVKLTEAMSIYQICKTYFGIWTPDAQEHVQGYNNWKTQFNAGDEVLIPQLLEKNEDGTLKLDVNGNAILTRTDILSQTEIAGATEKTCPELAESLDMSILVFKALNPSLPCK